MIEEALPTRVGYRGKDDSRFFGQPLLGALLGKETFASMVALSITGRRLSALEREVIDDLSVVASVSDPRIWPLKVARLASSYGGTLAAFGASQLYLEGDIIGMWSAGYAAERLLELRVLLDSKDDFERAAMSILERAPRLVGYGGVLGPHDERLDALRDSLRRRGRTEMTYWQLQEQFSAVVFRERGIEGNIGIGVAAALLDLNFTSAEISRMGFFTHLNSFISNAVEGAAQAPAVLRCLPTDKINYIGAPPRLSPRAERTEK